MRYLNPPGKKNEFSRIFVVPRTASSFTTIWPISRLFLLFIILLFTSFLACNHALRPICRRRCALRRNLYRLHVSRSDGSHGWTKAHPISLWKLQFLSCLSIFRNVVHSLNLSLLIFHLAVPPRPAMARSQSPALKMWPRHWRLPLCLRLRWLALADLHAPFHWSNKSNN